MKRIIPLLSIVALLVCIVSCDKEELNNINDENKKEIPRTPVIEFVDLGLSAKWATCNIGAYSPEEYGNYYAWGETETKTDYSAETYKWCEGSLEKLTKYCDWHGNGLNGFVDNKSILDVEDDAAHVIWGGDWRLPTQEECEELFNNCTITWASVNGVRGFRVTSKIEGFTDRSIFIPGAGYYDSGDLLQKRSCFYLTNSSLFSIFSGGTWGTKQFGDGRTRAGGYPIRPVCSSQVSLTLNVNTLILEAGNYPSMPITVTAKSGERTVKWPLKWSSDNPKVITVDEYGLIRTIAPGTATITISCLNDSVKCPVTVVEAQKVAEAVDLGLSVKWATCNVGASSPEKCGYYYAWGETEPKETFYPSNYKWFEVDDAYDDYVYYYESNSFTIKKYNMNDNYGTIDNNITLDPEDDVAHVKWGENWRMPSESEIIELHDSCTWELTTNSGVKGYKITSNVKGYENNFIFLPVAGYSVYNYLTNVSNDAFYWGNTVYSYEYVYGSTERRYNSILATTLIINEYYIDKPGGITGGDRYCGRNVRPVCP